MLRPSRRQVSSKTLLMLRSSRLQISSRRSWCYALDVFKSLLRRSWCYALHVFKYLQDALNTTLFTSSSNFSKNIGTVSKNLLALLSLAKWRDNLVQSFIQRSMCLWSNGCTECDLSLLLPKMCIRSWLKSWNERKTSTWKCETWNEKSK